MERSQWAGFAVVLFFYAMFAAGPPRVENPGEQSRLELAVSLSLGSVSIDPVMESYGTPFARSVRAGKTYSDKAPGASFAAVPVVWSIGALLPREGTSTLPNYWALRHWAISASTSLIRTLIIKMPTA